MNRKGNKIEIEMKIIIYTVSFHFLNIHIPIAAAITTVPTTIAAVTTFPLDPESFELLLLSLLLVGAFTDVGTFPMVVPVSVDVIVMTTPPDVILLVVVIGDGAGVGL